MCRTLRGCRHFQAMQAWIHSILRNMVKQVNVLYCSQNQTQLWNMIERALHVPTNEIIRYCQCPGKDSGFRISFGILEDGIAARRYFCWWLTFFMQEIGTVPLQLMLSNQKTNTLQSDRRKKERKKKRKM